LTKPKPGDKELLKQNDDWFAPTLKKIDQILEEARNS